MHSRSINRSILAFVGLLAVGLNSAFAASKQPNIVFIFSDDHAVQAISAYGSKINQTPGIDRLAKEGAVFVNSFCANSICGPSRACILTGKHSHINGFRRNGERFNGNQVTFPKLLQQAGYQTALVGKWHLGTDPTGFHYWEVLPGQGNYYNPDFLQMNGARKRYTGYCTDIITDRAVKWLDEERDKTKPFVLMCQHKAPHRNWSPAPRHFSMFDGKDIPEPDSLFDDYSGRSPLLKENEMSIKNHFYWGHDAKLHGEGQYPDSFLSGIGNREYQRMNGEQKAAWDKQYEPENQAFLEKMKTGEMSEREVISWKYQRYVKDYLRTIAALDENVGRVLDYLDENDLTENTIVIYSSDQGFYLGEHGWYDKRWMFEESLKMPFAVRWPGVISPGTQSTAL
ncbi:MAG: sulfatase, partial [Verrucomicrobia bacterium]|nr:sulfatase [Verrucomicrobiota bacterium]